MQDDKVKLELLVDMVKALQEYVQYLSYFIPKSRASQKCDVLKMKIKDIEKQIE